MLETDVRKLFEDVVTTGNAQNADLLWQYIMRSRAEIDELTKENNELRKFLGKEEPGRRVLVLAKDSEMEKVRSRVEQNIRSNPELARRVQGIQKVYDTAEMTDVNFSDYGMIFTSRSMHNRLTPTDRSRAVIVM